MISRCRWIKINLWHRGEKAEEKKLPQTTRSRPMSSYGGHCAFIVAVHVAQRQRQVRIEFVFVRERKREKERRKKRIKQTKEKETKRNKWRRKREEEEDLFSLVHQPNPLLGHSLFFCTHYIMSGSLLLLFSRKKQKQKWIDAVHHHQIWVARSTVESTHNRVFSSCCCW